MSKPKVIKDYDKLSEYLQQQIKLFYPHGFDKKLIMFKNAKKKLISALPFEGETYYYLVKMTKAEAQKIISNDADFGEDGLLKEDALERLKNLPKQVEEPIVFKTPPKPEPKTKDKGKGKAKSKAKAKSKPKPKAKPKAKDK